MAHGIRTGDPCGLNNGRSSKFRVGSRVRQTPEEGIRTYPPKRCENKNRDENNSPNILNDVNVKLFLTFLAWNKPSNYCQYLLLQSGQLSEN